MKTADLSNGKLFQGKYFLLGLILAFMIHASDSCLKDDYGTDGPDFGIYERDIKDGAKLVEAAFLSGDTVAIRELLTENASELYATELPRADSEQLTDVGEAMKTRKLGHYTDMYAEFAYTMDGVTYTFALAHQEDDSWKLMRF